MLKKRPLKTPVEDTGRLEGRVVANFGRHLLIEDDEGERHACVPRGRRLKAVCGDRVLWVPGAPESPGIVEELLPRDNALMRPDNRGRPEILAANLSQLLVVCAPKPTFDAYLLDRYLVAAELMGVDAAVICNKAELEALADKQDMRAMTEEFSKAGYPVIWTSAKQGTGLAKLTTLAADHTNILVGQSGVGKSSLLNALLPDVDASVGRLSHASGEGRHTTTVSMLHRLPAGGELIDSPGVRDYAPHLTKDQDLSVGFPEILEAGRHCHFSNCQHIAEPRCAVKAAVENGELSKRRYRSFCQLTRRGEQLDRSPG